MSDVSILVEFLRDDPIRGGRWFRHQDGWPVHEPALGTHVWRYENPTRPTVCVFCGVRAGKVVSPSWERCPERPWPCWTPPRTYPLLDAQQPVPVPPLPEIFTSTGEVVRKDPVVPNWLADWEAEHGKFSATELETAETALFPKTTP